MKTLNHDRRQKEKLKWQIVAHKSDWKQASGLLPSRLCSVFGSWTLLHQSCGCYIIQQGWNPPQLLHHSHSLLSSLKFFASVWSTRCKSFSSLSLALFFFKYPQLQSQQTVVSSASCIRWQCVTFRKLAAGILFVPAVCKTNTAAHCTHSQPPPSVGLPLSQQQQQQL